MSIPSIRTAPPSFGANDLLQSKTQQALGKLDIPIEFKVDSPLLQGPEANKLLDASLKPEGEDLRKAFQDFVGQTLFSQMISSMRSTQDGAAYFDGGRAEKIFQGQLDQILSEELSEASASKISDPMFKLFQLRRQ